MKVFKRMNDIISSNVNSMLDRMENPDKMIDLLTQRLSDAVIEMKSTISVKRAEEKGLERALNEKKEAEARWSERAKIAATKGEDELAKEAISERIRYERLIKLDEEALSSMKDTLTSLNASLEDAETKLSEMKAKRAELTSRAAAAKARIRANEAEKNNEDFERRLGEIRAKIERWEAMADLSLATSASKKAKTDWEEIEREAAIENELAALKKGALKESAT